MGMGARSFALFHMHSASVGRGRAPDAQAAVGGKSRSASWAAPRVTRPQGVAGPAGGFPAAGTSPALLAVCLPVPPGCPPCSHTPFITLPHPTRRYQFKVALCRKPYNHDWTACPYSHIGKADRKAARGAARTAPAVARVKRTAHHARTSTAPSHDATAAVQASRHAQQHPMDGTLCAAGPEPGKRPARSRLQPSAPTHALFHTRARRRAGVPARPDALQLRIHHVPEHAAKGQVRAR